MKILIKLPKIKIAEKTKTIITLLLFFLIAFTIRMIPIIKTGYPTDWADVTTITINMIEGIKKPLNYLHPYLDQPENWYKSWKNVYWYQTDPPITMITGGIISLFLTKKLNTGWITGALFYSLGTITIYYFIKELTKNKKIALLTSLIFALCPLDIWTISRGKIIHSLAFTTYPILLLSFYKTITTKEKKWPLYLGITSLIVINSYTPTFGVFSLGAITYVILTTKVTKKRIKIKTKNIKKSIKPILWSIILSTPYLIRLIISIPTSGANDSMDIFTKTAPISGLFDFKIIMEYFPHTFFGIQVYKNLGLGIKTSMLILITYLSYKALKRKLKDKEKIIIAFFAGPLLYYLTQFTPLNFYPRRILYQTNSLFIIGTGLSFNYLKKIIKKKKLRILLKGIILSLIIYQFSVITLFYLRMEKTLFINDERYKAIKWGQENIPVNEKLFFIEGKWGLGPYAKYFYKPLNQSIKESTNFFLYNKAPTNLYNYNYVVSTNYPTGINYKTYNLLKENYTIIFQNKEVLIMKKINNQKQLIKT